MIRVRFAPSNTGYLHIGNCRVALYNYLLSKKHNGTFILRIEDTDKLRSSEEFTHNVLDSLKFLGIEWDEGPYFQSQRFNRHLEIANKLEKDGILKRSKKQGGDMKEALAYKFPYQDVEFKDELRGVIKKDKETIKNIEELVILRSDGTPTYNFCCVVDDYDMKITDVIRGEDHIENTWKQILLYRVLGWQIPRFVHLPLILGSDGKPLSKRHGHTSIDEFRKEGYVKEALVNYLALLGWSHPEGKDEFELNELIENFSIERVNKSAAIFDEKKLKWLNGIKIRKLTPKVWAERINEYNKDNPVIKNFVVKPEFYNAFKDHGETLPEVLENMKTLTSSKIEDLKLVDEIKTKKVLFDKVYDYFSNQEKLDPTSIMTLLKEIQKETGIKGKELYHTFRILITGREKGPELDKLIGIMNITLIKNRLNKFKESIQ
ncbi:MAG: glutamate--tRNA ligase family protein [Candidatus Hydrogenedentota bacterium]